MELIQFLRRHHVDVCFLSDLHFVEPSLQVIYVEEFCFVMFGRVGIVLRAALARLWESHGRQVHTVDSDRLLQIRFPMHCQQMAFTAVYTPATQSASEKREHYAAAHRLRMQSYDPELIEIRGGDFNAHISANEAEPQTIGGPWYCLCQHDCWWAHSEGISQDFSLISC